MEPKPVTSKKWICPGCKFASKKKFVIIDHLTRCWTNPENRACRTCEFYNEDWQAGVNLSTCEKGIQLMQSQVDNCPMWKPRTVPLTTEFYKKNRYEAYSE